MHEKTGLIHLRPTAKRRDILAFLFRARLGGVTAAHVMLARWGNVRKRGAAPSPPNWKALIAASALPCRIRPKAEELCEHVEVECAFLGVPKLVSTPAAFGAAPGAFTTLTATGKPLVVILCAPLNDTEWYCHDGESAFTIDKLALVDLSCEVQSVNAETLRRGKRLLDLARLHHEAFAAAVATAAFRAAEARAQKSLRCVRLDSLTDYYEAHPFEWPSTAGW